MTHQKPSPLKSSFSYHGQRFEFDRSVPVLYHKNTHEQIKLTNPINPTDEIIKKSCDIFLKNVLPKIIARNAAEFEKNQIDQQNQNTETKPDIPMEKSPSITLSDDDNSNKIDNLIALFQLHDYNPNQKLPAIAQIIQNAENIENIPELNNTFNINPSSNYQELKNTFYPGMKINDIFGEPADHIKANLTNIDDVISYSKMINSFENTTPSIINDITGKFDLDEHIIFLIKEMRIQVIKLIAPKKQYLNNESNQPLTSNSTHAITSINDYVTQFTADNRTFEIEPASYIPTINRNEVNQQPLTEAKTDLSTVTPNTCDILLYDRYPIYHQIVTYECTCHNKLFPPIECKLSREQSKFLSTLLCHHHWTNILLNDTKDPKYCKFSKSQIPSTISDFSDLHLSMTKVKSLISSFLHTTQQLTKITTKYSQNSIPTQFNSKSNINLPINHNTCATISEFQTKQSDKKSEIKTMQNRFNALVTETAIHNNITNYFELHFQILKNITSSLVIIKNDKPFKQTQSINLLIKQLIIIAQLIQFGQKINICANQIDKLVQYNLILYKTYHKRKLLGLIKKQQKAFLNNHISTYIELHLSNTNLIIKSTTNRIKLINNKINKIKQYNMNPITEFLLVEQKQQIFNPRGINYRRKTNKPKTKTKTKPQSRTKQQSNQNRTRKQQTRQIYRRQKPRPKAKPNPRTKFTRQPRKQTQSAKKTNKQRKPPWRSNQPARSSRKSNSNNWRARPPRR